MQTFDVYLKKRLTEIDVIISQLVQRDVFSFFSQLYLLCSMEDVKVQKAIDVISKLEIDLNINDIIKFVYEILTSEVYLDTELDLVSQSFSDGIAEMVLTIDEMTPVSKDFIDVNSSLEIFVNTLDYYIAHSFGKIEFDMSLVMNQVEFLKYSLEKYKSELKLHISSNFASEKHIDLDEVKTFLSIDPTDIFYVFNMEGMSTMLVYASSIDHYVFKKVLHDLNPTMIFNTFSDEALSLSKYIEFETTLNLIAYVTDVLIQTISMESKTYLSCTASAGLKRYRLLEEMDNFTLADFDNMNLQELDYVIIVDET